MEAFGRGGRTRWLKLEHLEPSSLVFSVQTRGSKIPSNNFSHRIGYSQSPLFFPEGRGDAQWVVCFPGSNLSIRDHQACSSIRLKFLGQQSKRRLLVQLHGVSKREMHLFMLAFESTEGITVVENCIYSAAYIDNSVFQIMGWRSRRGTSMLCNHVPKTGPTPDGPIRG